MTARATRSGLLVVLALPLVAIALLACGDADAEGVLEVPAGASAERGKEALDAYGCTTCHTIPGINGADGQVGPPLTDYGRRLYIAGAVPNTFENLTRFIMTPDAIEPGTLMPVLGVSQESAADIAAYLATLQ